ncbi:pullulanase 1, chloroplastic-like [Bidens hawaiensis]|uniref:pullulanase 1, chloroplastic-like n=1 Tax=Bidens hawaiensis TaxID=980011 RepID=UPI00404AEA66
MSIPCHTFPTTISPTRFSFHTRNHKTANLTRSKPTSRIVKCKTTTTTTRHCCCCSTMPPLASSPPQDSLSYSRAYWVTRSIIAWDVDVDVGGSCFLYSSKSAALSVSANGIEAGYDLNIELERHDQRLPENVRDKFPHIKDYKAFKVPEALDLKSILKDQLAVALFDSSGRCINVTGLQLPGVIDDIFSYTGPLGAIFSNEVISFYLWAPTAQDIRAHIYNEPSGGEAVEIVQLKESSGVWSANVPRSLEGCYYVYEVTVYHPCTLQIEKCFVNDPYARGLSGDGKRTFVVNLDSDALKPHKWDDLGDVKPDIADFADISIYELHIRDFSANDSTVNPEIRGGYLAFTSQDSAGILHLKKLSDAGLTHIHLLPAFQFGEVDDQKENWKFVDMEVLKSLPPDSDEQQEYITAIQNEDGYNWGYNPVLWGVPKGSYATNPNGPSRIIEFRKMVQALNHIGLRVVLDVVYNHLHGNGPADDNSVLDKIVPGYYLRRNADGFIENSTCVNNTASEHFMVDRLIVDDILNWVVNYKIDGFRFDLMGHLMKSTMMKAKSVLKNLSRDKDKIDGGSIFLYGEGWDFGEVANNGRGINASQCNLGGSGIGSFNDRIRDALLGGSPFGHPLQQGFLTGLSLQPNGHDHGTEANTARMLALSKDHIQVGMAANLKDFVLTNCDGQEVKGSDISTYGGTPVAYASQPVETINYVSAHDNETLFDIISLKTPMEISVDERCRINHLATSIIALSQGVPFFHCGDEILRSKSLDRDSYNSGDWFNRIDFSYNSNNWGVGLPPKGKNEKSWPLIKPRLASPSFKPHKSHILSALENFQNLLLIRYSSVLFRLRTANAIQERVRFHNTGLSHVPGVIVMSIEDGHEGVPGLTRLDPTYSYIVVIINASPSDISFASPVLRGKALRLHPVQMKSTDDLVKSSAYDTSTGCFSVPSRTTSVFVEPRNFQE